MYYVRYFFKCCIRKIVNLIFKPKYLFTLIIIGLLFSILLCTSTYAAVSPPNDSWEEIPTEYIDSRIIGGSISSTNKSGVINDFGGCTLYFAPVSYKGQKIGCAIQSTTQIEYRIGYFEKVNIGATGYYLHQGTSGLGNLVTQGGFVSPFNEGYFVLTVYHGDNVVDVSIYSQDSTSDAINNMGSVITSNQDKNTDKIIESQEEIKDSITNSEVSDSSMTVNTDGLGMTDEQGVNDFFSNMLNTIKNTFLGINSTVETIEIPIPFTSDNLVLSSDLVSKHIQGTAIYSLIQGLWWFVIGKYIVMFSYRMIAWLSTGKIADKGISSFIDYLDKNNEIINSYMM